MTESKSKDGIRICPLIEPGLKQQWNQMFWWVKKLGSGIAGQVGHAVPASFVSALVTMPTEPQVGQVSHLGFFGPFFAAC